MLPKRDRDGFTLIELLIVVVIIGILAAIAIPKFSSTREKAFRSTVMADLKNLAAAQELYHNEHYTYHNNLTDLQAVESDGVTISVNEATGSGWAATASHVGIAAHHCGVYHGDATASNGDPASEVGVITCTF